MAPADLRKKPQHMITGACMEEIVHKSGWSVEKLVKLSPEDFLLKLCQLQAPTNSLEATDRLEKIRYMNADMEYSSIRTYLDDWEFQLKCQRGSPYCPSDKNLVKLMMEGLQPSILQTAIKAAAPMSLEKLKELIFIEAERIRSWNVYTKINEKQQKAKENRTSGGSKKSYTGGSTSKADNNSVNWRTRNIT